MLLSLSGAALALLQTAAWVSMLACRAPSQGIAASVKSTFDGKHPCPMCKAVDAGKATEKKSESPLKSPRFEFPAESDRFCLIAVQSDGIVLTDEFCESVCSFPLLRPPRV